MKRTLLVATLALAMALPSAVYAADINFTATLRPGVTASIRLEVLENPNAGPNATNVLFYPGLAHGGNSFKPLIAELFTGQNVANAVIVHPVGRGGSSIPSGMLFGAVDIDDDAQVLVQSIQQSAANGTPVQILGLHSMAGLVAGRAAVLTSLPALGIKRIVGYSLAAPKEVADPFLESKAGLYLLSLYTKNNAHLGSHVELTPIAFLGLFFSADGVTPVPAAPVAGQVVAQGYKVPASLAEGLQTASPQDGRPSIPAGVFSGMSLRFIVGTSDIFGSSTYDVYVHLTGDVTGSGIVVIDDPNAVHDLIITIPALAAEASGLK